jgi:endogenous inhibitor of DNA gyrase (YacG/DUF329 family)
VATFSAKCPTCGTTAELTPDSATSETLHYTCSCGANLSVAREAARNASGGSPSTSAPRLSQVGQRTEHGLACPRCGGTSFKLKRSLGQKAGFAGGMAATILTAGAVLPTFGVAGIAAIAKARRIVCIPCGMTFTRD